MAQLKEIKSRMQSVRSTQKITSAMMMVSSARLQKVQRTIENLSRYEQKLNQILQLFLQQEEKIETPFTEVRTVKRVAIVAFASNTGLAGRYNNNIIDRVKEVVESYKSLGEENILLYPLGEKLAKAARKMTLSLHEEYNDLAEKPTYKSTKHLAEELMEMFSRGKIDRVELIYHHFKSKGSQELFHLPFLPIELKATVSDKPATDYIVEPDRSTIITLLIPKVLKMKLFTAHLDSVTSEHAARMTAMQMATDNAEELSDELKLEYNKLRQQSITNELLDIVGGSFGQHS